MPRAARLGTDGDDVEVGRLAAQQRVAHGPADGVRLEPEAVGRGADAAEDGLERKRERHECRREIYGLQDAAPEARGPRFPCGG